MWRCLYKEVWPSNAFIGNLLRLIVLKREGYDSQVSREIRGYYLKMANFALSPPPPLILKF